MLSLAKVSDSYSLSIYHLVKVFDRVGLAFLHKSIRMPIRMVFSRKQSMHDRLSRSLAALGKLMNCRISTGGR
jgi:hypothetical protein